MMKYEHIWIKDEKLEVWRCWMCRKTTTKDPFRKWLPDLKKWIYQKYYDWATKGD